MKFIWPNEFVDLDIRKHTKLKWQSYQVSQDFFWHRHNITLPGNKLNSTTVLDLGCYHGATGHWAIEHGCEHYTGVELVSESLQQAQQLLSKYHSTNKFSLVKKEIGEFLSTCQDHYDIIVAWGVLNTFVDPISVIADLCRIGDYVLIDGYPPVACADLNDIQHHRALIEINPMSCQLQITDDNPTTFQGSRISLQAIEMIGERYGFQADRTPYYELSQTLPDVYGHNGRIMSVLTRNQSIVRPRTYRDIYG